MIDIFGFADQDKTTKGLGFNLFSKRKGNNDIILSEAGVADIVVIRDILGHVEKFTPSLCFEKHLVADQVLTETPTVLCDVERTVFRKPIKKLGTWTFELRIKSGGNFHLR